MKASCVIGCGVKPSGIPAETIDLQLQNMTKYEEVKY